MKPDNILCGSCNKKEATVYFEIIDIYAWCDDCLKHWLLGGSGGDYDRKKSRMKFITYEEYLVADIMTS